MGIVDAFVWEVFEGMKIPKMEWPTVPRLYKMNEASDGLAARQVKIEQSCDLSGLSERLLLVEENHCQVVKAEHLLDQIL